MRRYDRDPDDERELDIERREWQREEERKPSTPTTIAVRRAAAKAYPAAFAPEPEWRGDKVDS